MMVLDAAIDGTDAPAGTRGVVVLVRDGGVACARAVPIPAAGSRQQSIVARSSDVSRMRYDANLLVGIRSDAFLEDVEGTGDFGRGPCAVRPTRSPSGHLPRSFGARRC